jgi:hypothetical protein
MQSNPPTTRASLLAGLRTGGVRSASSPLANIPHTAAPSGSFNIPRSSSTDFPSSFTAAVDAPNNTFSHQQSGMNPNSAPFSPQVQVHALQMQVMQLEILRLQHAMQTQNYQAELFAQQQSQNRRTTIGFNPPATAGPTHATFDLRAATVSAQMRRANHAEQLKSQLGLTSTTSDHLPMTAAIGGKFACRTTGAPNITRFDEDIPPLPQTPGGTTVISGGTALGNLPSTNSTGTLTPNTTPSKSDSAVSWRRGGNNNSVLSGINNNRTLSSPSVKITPPPADRVSPPLAERNSPPPATPLTKARPVPLRFSPAVSQPLPVLAVDSSSPTDSSGDTTTNSSRADDGYSTSSSTAPAGSWARHPLQLPLRSRRRPKGSPLCHRRCPPLRTVIPVSWCCP